MTFKREKKSRNAGLNHFSKWFQTELVYHNLLQVNTRTFSSRFFQTGAKKERFSHVFVRRQKNKHFRHSKKGLVYTLTANNRFKMFNIMDNIFTWVGDRI